MKKKIILIAAAFITTSSYAQVGINTQNPQAAFHVDGGKDNSDTGVPTALQQNNDFVVTSNGRVGVGTISPDPSAKLELDATNKGFLPPRIVLISSTDGVTIANPAKGLIVYNTNTNTAQMMYGEGLYCNVGTKASPNWVKLAQSTNSSGGYILGDVYSVVAANSVDTPATSLHAIRDNVDLGLSLTVTIPANSSTKVMVQYSVPMGTADVNNTSTIYAYYGIRFLKNGVEESAGSRKATVPTNNDAMSKMTTVSSNYSEQINNTTNAPITVTYTLNGYVESNNQTIRFNMYSAGGANYNWGKATMFATTFIK